jgi:5-formyltetrahydrofolate cyclo-ligase
MPADSEIRHEDLAARKRRIRTQSLSRRRAQPDKQRLSERIQERLIARLEYRTAQTISVYVSTPAEVQTHDLIRRARGEEKKGIAVPCCIDGHLHLFQLESLQDLVPGHYGILEPRDELRRDSARWLDASQIQLFVVPGLAFDDRGGRLGLGKGYYDRLLGRISPEVPKIAVAFESQMIPQVPMGPHDVTVDAVITERDVYHASL